MLVQEIRRAAHLISLALERELGPGVGQAEAHVLAHLGAAEPLTPGELARGFGHRQSTLTSIVDRLAERGLVERAANPADRRSFLVTLTPAGRREARRATAALAGIEQRALSRISAHEAAGVAAFAAALGEVLDD